MMINNRVNKLPVEFCRVDVAKGQQRSEEFLKINPLGKVPAFQVRLITTAATHASTYTTTHDAINTGW